jgi:hypothetical protein
MKEREHLEDLITDKKIIFKWISNLDTRLWTRFIFLMVRVWKKELVMELGLGSRISKA